MTMENMTDLRRQMLVGMTGKYGDTWHSDKSAESIANHFDGPVPIERVRELFREFAVKVSPIYLPVANGATMDIDGVTVADPFAVPGMSEIPNFQAIVRESDNFVLAVHSNEYLKHDFDDVLLSRVSSILGDGSGALVIGSAGILKKGAQGFVCIEVPESFKTPEGEVFRPRLLAATSHDGSLAMTYKRVVMRVVCDNTMRAGLSEVGQVIKIKHTSRSDLNLSKVRSALNLLHGIADDYRAEVKTLCEIPVSDTVWTAFLDAHVSLLNDRGERKTGGPLTKAENKRDALTLLWRSDARVSPYRGTAWGVLQAVNTYAHHMTTIQNDGNRFERNMGYMVSGKFDALDQNVVSTLDKVLVAAR